MVYLLKKGDLGYICQNAPNPNPLCTKEREQEYGFFAAEKGGFRIHLHN